MVNKQDLIDFSFKTIDDYFSHLFKTKQEGKELEALKLYAKLSKPQKSDFRDWLDKNIDVNDAWSCICFLEE